MMMKYIWPFLLYCFLVNYSYAVSANSLVKAKHAFQQGNYKTAHQLWQKVVDSTGKNPFHRLEALLGIARLERRLGTYQAADDALQRALSIAKQLDNTIYHALLFNELSKLHLSQGEKNYPAAVRSGQRALNIARSVNDSWVLAMVLNHWGNLLAIENDYEKALDIFNQALRHLDSHQKSVVDSTGLKEIETLKGKIWLNRAQIIFLQEMELAQVGFEKPPFTASLTALQSVFLMMQTDWGDTYKQVFGLITLSQLAKQIQAQLPNSTAQLSVLISQSLMKAQQLADRLNNPTAKAYAYGYLGQWYEQHQRYQEALFLTRQALFFTQQSRQRSFINYLWQWQLGRLYKAQGDDFEAISAYQAALENFQSMPNLVATSGYRLSEMNFRSRVAPIYFELADLLLQQARKTTGASQKKALLRQAIVTIEGFREAELQNYLQIECIELETKCLGLAGGLAAGTALLYPILLPDRLELLLLKRDDLVQVIVNIDEKTMRAMIKAFLSALRQPPYATEAKTRDGLITVGQKFQLGKKPETCTPRLRSKKSLSSSIASMGYLKPAQMLYRWFIEPLLSHLVNTSSLVIVPDGILRKIPFAALHDGKAFLVEKYALTTAPSLCANFPSEALRTTKTKKNVLLGGLSESVQGFSALPCAEYELNVIQKLYGDTAELLLNQKFMLPELRHRTKQTDYAIIHFASHGHFGANLENTFVLTYDNKLTLNRLEQLIDHTQLKTKPPLELLTLSACETAVGDDWAALGLAGVALKAGAQSVLASLWRVDDEATPAVIIEFYRQWQLPRISKAQALQRAQKIVLRDKAYESYRHPYYWAAFLLIGHAL